MTDDDNRVEVRIGGKVFAGWKSVVISMSVEQVARAFAMEVTTDFPGNVDFRTLQSGDLCEVFIGEDRVCTGYIEATPVSYDGKKVRVQIQGKSKTIDLVQCCPPSAAYPAPSSGMSNLWANVKGQDVAATGNEVEPSGGTANSWKDIPVAKIIAELCAPYGIQVYAPTLGSKIATHTVNPGETVIKSINRLIDKENLIVTDDADGNLVIMDPTESGDLVATLKTGENILAGSARFDASKRFSQYVVLGQHSGSDSDFGASAAEDRGIAYDEKMKRFRLHVIKDNGQSSIRSCADRARFERDYQAAGSDAVEITIQGWRPKTGSLWKVNSSVRIEDSVLHLSRTMTICDVSFSLGATGMQTKLKLKNFAALKRKEQRSKQSETTKESNLWSDVK